ncbi:MAG: lipopolysaccharide biosynthesis protein [Alistipes sp.]|nr:lipopolysaccharide biosynthesis protein [Alistipes sp.]
MQYRSKVITGFLWSAGEKFATTAVRIIASIFILRYLDPKQFGVVELLAVFYYISYTIVDSGFSQALIRKKDAGERDYNSIFYLNIAIAAGLYAVLILLSFPLARFFREPQLSGFAPVLFLTIPLSALGLIQTTLLAKRMDFRTLSKISFTATVISSVLLIVLAANGFGPWALIWQTVVNEAVKTGYLWISSRWRPRRIFSMASVRALYPFGSRLFLSGVINQVFHRVSTVLIGRLHNSGQVGLYNQSLKLKDSVAIALSYSVYNVSYPALSSFQDDEQKLRLVSRQVVQVLSFILFPVMAGLILVAPEGFLLAGREKWVPAIPYFQIFCISAFFLPLTHAGMNILRAKGLGNTILRAEILKKIFAAVVITAAAFFSVRMLAWAYTVWMGFEMMVNAHYAKATNGYGYRMQGADTLPYLAMSAVMFACVQAAARGTLHYLPYMVTASEITAAWIVLAVKICTGVLIYTLLAFVIKPVAWREILSIVKGIFNKGDRT